MPIFEYKCKQCDKQFEELVSRGDAERSIACPFCKSNKTEKLMSVFGALGLSQNAPAMPACGSSCAGPSCAAAGQCPRFA
ncbi:MAG: zinc ribbon domain-containing protein [Chitinivibrionales bacterium]|nr:zinc ribbon domain-containing protein [Chitinivibrionales bacterium]